MMSLPESEMPVGAAMEKNINAGVAEHFQLLPDAPESAARMKAAKQRNPANVDALLCI